MKLALMTGGAVAKVELLPFIRIGQIWSQDSTAIIEAAPGSYEARVLERNDSDCFFRIRRLEPR